MTSLRTSIVAAATAGFGLIGCAQTPVDPAANRPAATSASGAGPVMPMAGAGMARMDEHMKAMREMHDKMMAAKTPEARAAMMAEHMKLMQDGMAMMGGMGPGGMGGMQGMGPMGGDMAARHQMMEKRMEMMQSMMQMMMDRMAAPPAKP